MTPELAVSSLPEKVMGTQNGNCAVLVSCNSCGRKLHVLSVCGFTVTVIPRVFAGTFPGLGLVKRCTDVTRDYLLYLISRLTH